VNSLLIAVVFKGAIAFAGGFWVAFIFERKTKKWAMWDRKLGWQIHHSIFGLALFLVALFLPRHKIELIFSGLGIIFQYFLSDGLVFVRKW